MSERKYIIANGCVIDEAEKRLISGVIGCTIPGDGSVTSIATGAFYGVSNGSVTIPKCVTTVESQAFEDNFELHIYLEAENLPEGYAEDWCSYQGLTEDEQWYELGESDVVLYFGSTVKGDVEQTGYFLMKGGTLTSFESASDVLILPYFVTAIGPLAFSHCDFKRIMVDERNHSFFATGDCLVERDSKRMVLGCENSVIPNDGTVTCLASYCFDGVSACKIFVPACIKKAERYAFCDNDALAIECEAPKQPDQWAFDWCNYQDDPKSIDGGLIFEPTDDPPVTVKWGAKR